MELFDSQMSLFWNIWVVGLITVFLLIVVTLTLWGRKMPAGSAKNASDSTGHEYDGITELNNPLPRWWLYMFYSSVIFTIIYLILYPGYGNFKGILGWTQESQLHQEIVDYDEKVKPLYAKFNKMSIIEMSKDTQAHKMGRGLFLSFCSVCHGSNAKGTVDFPNLTDKDWLYGGQPEQIQASILNGRGGVMPPYGGLPLSKEKLNSLVHYVLSLSGRKHDAALATEGKNDFAICSACHGIDGKGSQIIGAPNLTDRVWLHGRRVSAIKHNITTGFDGNVNRMPSFKDFLGADKVKVLASYVYGLSNK